MKTFRHSTNERNRSAVLKLRMAHGAAGYGVYMMLLERLAAEPDLRSDLDYDMLAYDFHVDSDLIRHVIEDFDLFIIDLDDNNFQSEMLNSQISPKARQKRDERLIDQFIASRLADLRWMQSTAQSYKTTPFNLGTLMKTTFRQSVLDSPQRPLNTYRLSCLLAGLLNEKFKKTDE